MAIIQNILFDLGGVLLNIDYNKTSQAFKELGIQNFDELFSQHKAAQLFENLEVGHISEEAFYETILQNTKPGVHKIQVQAAWNAMLLDFRINSFHCLKSLADKYNLFLLSNTNSIHLTAFEAILLRQTQEQSLENFFKKTYYSHQIGKRKPYLETYRFVLEDAGLIAKETLFIDDTIANIEAAAVLKINTYHFKPHEKIEDLFL